MSPATQAPTQRAWLRARQQWRLWLEQQHIRPARFQQRAWKAHIDGYSGLICAPTGSGKTLAAIGGALIQALALQEGDRSAPTGIRILWITPLRALASDTTRHLLQPVQELLPHWRTALRTSDASAADRTAARKGQAQLLVTTPESLALLLTSPEAGKHFQHLQTIIVDEWHELLPSKRGVLLQLNLARLRHIAPAVQTWGVSATIGNLEEALQVLVRECNPAHCTIVQDERAKPFTLHSLLPPQTVRLPWAGHLGLANLGEVLRLVLAQRSCLIFTNTRAQAELWFSALASIWPLDSSALAIHHGSLDQAMRAQVEEGLRQQRMRCVVATSSLDLGVDFPAVDLVIQIGAAHSVSRTVQRAGRARHRPGVPVHLTAVATQALDLCEFAATRELARNGAYESRPPLSLCLDVLSQHAMSMALADGFDPTALLQEIRTTAAFAQLEEDQWQAVLDFLEHGGQALQAYPQYRRLVHNPQGHYVPADAKVARNHRMSLGTITDSAMVRVQFLKGARLGSVEEAFISKLSPGDIFNFAGRSLELFRVEHLTAWVRKASRKGDITPVWSGGSLPFSDAVGQRMKALLAHAHHAPASPQEPEMQHLAPLVSLQAQRSHVPTEAELLLEVVPTGSGRRTRSQRDSGKAGMACFLYAFAGRTLHEGLAMLLAHRIAQQQPNTLAWSCNHIGLMLLPSAPVALDSLDWHALLTPHGLEADLAAAVNFSEMARRRFREIAQIAGLLHARQPGMNFNTRQLQVSAGLLFDVLSQYDPQHVLLQAAQREALERDLRIPDLQALLKQLQQQRLIMTRPDRHTPLSFGLWAESLRGQLSNESWLERVQRMARRMEA